MTWTDPTDAELHAYADDQLSPEGRARVADWLAEHPAAAAELAAWRAQNDAIRALFAPYATAGPADGLLIAAPQRA